MTFLQEHKFGYRHWCPACQDFHYIQTYHSFEPNWLFNGDFEFPDFKPEVSVRYTCSEEDLQRLHLVRLCHYSIDNGHINYYSDSTHDLRGQSREMVELESLNGSETFGSDQTENI